MLLLALPLAWFVVIYLASLVLLLITSFWSIDAFTTEIVQVWNLDNFQTILTNETYRTII
ncbi:MAG: ABC transporter permease, partial [Chloroflexi bacterium]